MAAVRGSKSKEDIVMNPVDKDDCPDATSPANHPVAAIDDSESDPESGDDCSDAEPDNADEELTEEKSSRTLLSQFERGHLLYGMQDIRISILSKLKRKIIDDIPVTVDKYVDQLFESTDTSGFIANKRKELSTASITEKLRYSFITAPGFEFKENEKKLGHKIRLRRRICKAELENPKSSKHFILDGIDLRLAFDREYSLTKPLTSKKLNVKIAYDCHTSAELHFVLKNWERVSQSTRFYSMQGNNFVECNLFDWLASQEDKGRVALLKWATEHSKKLSANTFALIKQACLEPPKNRIRSSKAPLAPPPTPKPQPLTLNRDPNTGSIIPIHGQFKNQISFGAGAGAGAGARAGSATVGFSNRV